MTEVVFGEGARKDVYSWRRRHFYGIIGLAIFIFLLLALAIAWVTTRGSIDMPTLAIGFIIGSFSAVYEYLDVSRKAKNATVADGRTLIAREKPKRSTWMMTIVWSAILATIIVTADYLGIWPLFYSFIIGVGISLGILLLAVGFLLEVRFGKLYIVTRN